MIRWYFAYFLSRPQCEKCLLRVATGPRKTVHRGVKRKTSQELLPYLSRASNPLEGSRLLLRPITPQTLQKCYYFQIRPTNVLTQYANKNRFFVYGGTLSLGGPRRDIGGAARAGARMAGKILKIRYLILTSVVGGGVALNKVIKN